MIYHIQRIFNNSNSWFSSEPMKPKREWGDIFRVLKGGKDLSTKIRQKLSVKNEVTSLRPVLYWYQNQSKTSHTRMYACTRVQMYTSTNWHSLGMTINAKVLSIILAAHSSKTLNPVVYKKDYKYDKGRSTQGIQGWFNIQNKCTIQY